MIRSSILSLLLIFLSNHIFFTFCRHGHDGIRPCFISCFFVPQQNCEYLVRGCSYMSLSSMEPCTHCTHHNQLLWFLCIIINIPYDFYIEQAKHDIFGQIDIWIWTKEIYKFNIQKYSYTTFPFCMCCI